MDPTDNDSIISFSTPLADSERVDALPAPVLELAYVHHHLSRDPQGRRPDRMRWLESLLAREAGLAREIREFWAEQEQQGGGGESAPGAGFDLFLLAAELGYARDGRVERFLTDLPELPVRLLARLERQGAPSADETYREQHPALVARMRALTEPARAARLAEQLTALWRALAPEWTQAGYSEVKAACDEFLQAFRETGDVLEALPPHHFTQFEKTAKLVRSAQATGRILVAPLYFADGGGFHFEARGTTFVGFGLRSGTLFVRTASQVAELAGRMKALADPTRLMLLALISRFANLNLTVGDLAVQLGVSQPTVSGHLKVLREAGLVELRRQGNRSYYRVDATAVRQTLAALEEAVLEA